MVAVAMRMVDTDAASSAFSPASAVEARSGAAEERPVAPATLPGAIAHCVRFIQNDAAFGGNYQLRSDFFTGFAQMIGLTRGSVSFESFAQRVEQLEEGPLKAVYQEICFVFRTVLFKEADRDLALVSLNVALRQIMLSFRH